MNGLTITGIKLDDKAAAEVLTTAAEAGIHGIGYWAQVRSALRAKGRIVSFQVLDMEGAEEGEEPKRYKVDLEDIRKAVSLILRAPENFHGWAERIMDDDGLDGPLADAIVQVACFGKVIYG